MHKHSKLKFYLVLSLLISANSSVSEASSGGGRVGVPSSPRDWQAGGIAVRIRRQLNSRLPKNENASEKFVARLFDDRKVTYALTVRVDGTIAKNKVVESSGSKEVDQKGLDLIERASPFFKAPSPIATEQTYLIEFPRVSVKGI